MTSNYSANPTPLPLPLQITSQPQDRTVSSDIGNAALIGETTWLAGTGFARSRVIWERSIDSGQTWEIFGNSIRQDGALSLDVSPFLNGNMFRATAYPYTPFTTLANFSSQDAKEVLEVSNLSSASAPVRIYATAVDSKNIEFMMTKDGQFKCTINFILASQPYSWIFNAQILNKWTIATASNKSHFVQTDITLKEGDIIRFTLDTDQPDNLFPRSHYTFEFFSWDEDATVGFDKDLGVTSEPMTLTVI